MTVSTLYTPSQACLAAQAFLQSVLDQNASQRRPCPDLALEVVETFNACDFATSPLALADLVQSVAMFACAPVVPNGWTLGARYGDGEGVACVYFDDTGRAVVWDMDQGGYLIAHGSADGDLWKWNIESGEARYHTFSAAFSALHIGD